MRQIARQFVAYFTQNLVERHFELGAQRIILHMLGGNFREVEFEEHLFVNTLLYSHHFISMQHTQRGQCLVHGNLSIRRRR